MTNNENNKKRVQTLLTQQTNSTGPSSSGIKLALALLASTITFGAISRADIVADWNSTLSAAINASTDPPPTQGRKAAIVQVAVFDAVNGIARKYQPYFVTDRAPAGARQEAAAAQAAYTTLLAMYPSQEALFDTQLAASKAAIGGSKGRSSSIARGLQWGEFVEM